MSPIWDADVDLEAYEAQMLIEIQFPELDPAKLKLLGTGWDNWAYLVNDTHIVRFPRRQMGADLIEVETAWLPRLAPLLPLPIPQPELVGEPEGPFPYTFAGYRRLAGRTACGVRWTPETRRACAAPLARFLRALHDAHPEDEGEDVPGDTIQRAVLPPRAEQTAERLDALDPALPRAAEIKERVFALAKSAPREGPLCWVHGDFYPRHLLVDDDALPCGVIDWGDVHVGDPALDLMIAYMLLDAPAREAFFETYGDVSQATHDRARFRALYYGAALTTYGRDVGDDDLLHVADEAFTHALA